VVELATESVTRYVLASREDSMEDERYEECEDCEERFVGDDAIRSYLRETRFGRVVCISCLEKRVKKERKD
jgi:hypothetical protein